MPGAHIFDRGYALGQILGTPMLLRELLYLLRFISYDFVSCLSHFFTCLVMTDFVTLLHASFGQKRQKKHVKGTFFKGNEKHFEGVR